MSNGLESARPQLALSHLGYLPTSPKTLTLIPAGSVDLPETIPFYIRQNCFRMPRDVMPLGGVLRAFSLPLRHPARTADPSPGLLLPPG